MHVKKNPQKHTHTKPSADKYVALANFVEMPLTIRVYGAKVMKGCAAWPSSGEAIRLLGGEKSHLRCYELHDLPTEKFPPPPPLSLPPLPPKKKKSENFQGVFRQLVNLSPRQLHCGARTKEEHISA